MNRVELKAMLISSERSSSLRFLMNRVELKDTSSLLKTTNVICMVPNEPCGVES